MKKLYSYLFFFFLGVASLHAQNGFTSMGSPALAFAPDRLGCSGLATDSAGRVWISFKDFFSVNGTLVSNRTGLCMQDANGQWKIIRVDSLGGPATRYLTDIQHINGKLYAGSSAGFLCLGNGESCTTYKYHGAGASGNTDTINAFTLYRGKWLLATQGGLLVFDPGNISQPWKLYNTTNSSLPTDKIYSVAGAGNVYWLASNAGVIALNPSSNSCVVFNKSNSEFYTDTLLAVACNSAGEIWAGGVLEGQQNTASMGLYKWENTQFKKLENISGFCQHHLFDMNNFPKILFHNNRVVLSGATLKSWGIQNVYYSYFGTTNGYENTLTAIPNSIGNPIATWGEVKQNKITLVGVGNNLQVFRINTDSLQEDTTYAMVMARNKQDAIQMGHDQTSELTINNLSVPVHVIGDMLWDFVKEKNLRIKGSCQRIAFSSSLWMGGMADGNLYTAANTYREYGRDFDAGPLRITTGTHDANMALSFARHWKVEERMIHDFLANRTKPGYRVPDEILNWPAHGDSLNGYSPYLAPFVDTNHNGVYDPVQGDYPAIEGQQSLFHVYNDDILHSESMSSPLHVEVHSEVYGYACDKISDTDSLKALNNTVIFHFTIFNRSNRIYRDFVAGLWLDANLGNYGDDYFGSNPRKEYMYWFNGDSLDDGFYGFGKNPPAAALVMLNGMKDSLGNQLACGGMRSYNNDFSLQGNPFRPEHYYNYLTNKWKDGSPVTYGGNGKGGSDSNKVFMYCGNTDPLSRPEWTEAGAGNPPGDRRIIVHSKPTILKAGEKQEITFALVFTPSLGKKTPELLQDLDADVTRVKNWYANKSFPSCSLNPLGIDAEAAPNQHLLLYPNPVNHMLQLQLSHAANLENIAVFDLSGKEIKLPVDLTRQQLDVSALENGIYFLRIQTPEGKLTGKFVVNH